MKNNTKVRLHLSKQLFESLASQVLLEAKGKKNFGAGMEEVKAPKGEKKTKDHEPEKKEESVEEVSGRPGLPKAPGLNISKNATPNVVYSKQDLKVKFMELARQLNLMKGLDNAETSAIGRLIDDIIAKLKDGTIANQINIAGKAFKNATKNVKTSVNKEGIEEMETKVAEESEVSEALTSETGLIEVGEWAAKFLGKTITDDQALMTLGADVLTAATGAAALGGLGLAMYADNIKAGIKKAAVALKNLAKGGGNVQEGDGDNPLAHLDPQTIAALKK